MTAWESSWDHSPSQPMMKLQDYCHRSSWSYQTIPHITDRTIPGKSSMLNDSITEGKIEDRNEKTDKKPMNLNTMVTIYN